MSIDDSGNLIIHTSLGDVKDSKPYCYQVIDGKEVEVGCNFVILNAESQIATTPLSHPSQGGDKGKVFALTQNNVTLTLSVSEGEGSRNEILRSTQNDKNDVIARSDSNEAIPKFVYGFQVPSYNKAYPLIIDPGLEYSTFLGGSGGEQGYDIAVDDSGNAYVMGHAISSNFPTTPGAFDTSYNGDLDSFVAKFSFNSPPDCSGAYPSLLTVWPPNHQMVNIDILGVADPDGDPVTITITGITQDEPTKGTGIGSGNTCPDGGGVGTSTAQVRAERAGTPRLPGNGRVYKISFMASDGKGGECTGAVEVCVQHDQRPGNGCIDDGQVYNSTTCP